MYIVRLNLIIFIIFMYIIKIINKYNNKIKIYYYYIHIILIQPAEISYYFFKRQILQANINLWNNFFPKVNPYYAVKCNNNHAVLSHLVNNNWNFDCASIAEINLIRKINSEINTTISNKKSSTSTSTSYKNKVNSDIIFANPVKWNNDIHISKKLGIKLFTLDNLNELGKISGIYPESNYLLRIAVNDEHSKCKLNTKFGIKLNEIDNFFEKKQHFSPKFTGFAFHVGSNCMSYESYKYALESIDELIKKYDTNHTNHMNNMNNVKIVDIGGGFIKNIDMLTKISEEVSKRVIKYPNIKWIAEPGRLIVNDAFDLYTTVVNVDGNRVFINNSIYGDLNNILFDHSTPDIEIIRNNTVIYSSINVNKSYELCKTELNKFPIYINDLHNSHESHNSYDSYDSYNIFGSTCDSIDILFKDIKLPRLINGDVIKFINMGAYTISSRTNFNGIPVADIREID